MNALAFQKCIKKIKNKLLIEAYISLCFLRQAVLIIESVVKIM